MSVRGPRESADERAGWLWVVSVAIGLVVFLGVPVGLGLYTSLANYALLEPPLWIGAEHY